MLPTIGVDFAKTTIQVEDTTIVGHLWDTAGQECYRSIANVYYRNADGALIVYDITQQSTFNELPEWFQEFEQHTSPKCIKVLVGNKSDLTGRVISEEEGMKLAKKNNAAFLETSAKDSTNVEKAFTLLLQEIHKQKQQEGITTGKQQQKRQPQSIEIEPKDHLVLRDPAKEQEEASSGCPC
eukprot:CAMPEP_0117428442 /NCGR_PEP_ID=MMETSP0758-20121206/8143_1 /TAXON_ID=63605 /ORGANISM="Percolomonas cosmopolitus, Strain AE-1 (ATCC 50343)" /LENGTH=181 /DNA_ID=CAMNT_0005214789 /DNA_START=190 /DNA_END=735 /DNA_ORIENTATION=+